MAIVATLDILTRANTAGLVGQFQRATLTLQRFGERALGLRSLLGGLAAAFTVRSIEQFIKSGMEEVATITKMAQSLGMGTEAMAAYQNGAEHVGIETEALVRNLKTMRVTIGEASEGSGAATKALETLGVSAADIANLPAEEQLKAIAEGFRTTGINVQTTQAAMEIFGSRTAVQLIPILSKGRAGLEAMEEEARKSGIAFDALSGEKVRAANLALKEAWEVVDALKRALAIELAPVLTAVAQYFGGVGASAGNMRDNVRKAMDTIISGMAMAANVTQIWYAGFLSIKQLVQDVFLLFAMGIEQMSRVGQLVPGAVRPQWLDDAREAARGFRQYWEEALDATEKKLEGTIGGQWWGAALKENLAQAREAADAAAKEALAGRAPITEVGMMGGMMGGKTTPANAAVYANTIEAASAIIKARQAMGGDPAVRTAKGVERLADLVFAGNKTLDEIFAELHKDEGSSAAEW